MDRSRSIYFEGCLIALKGMFSRKGLITSRRKGKEEIVVDFKSNPSNKELTDKSFATSVKTYYSLQAACYVQALKDILERTKDAELTADQVAEIKAAQEKLMTGAQALFTKMYEQMQGANGAGPDMSNMGGAADMGAQSAGTPEDDIIDGDFREV